ncbi:MAG TPA: phosphatidylglycerol lysyltransferase domain-containing protein, partial [Petrotogaceae bacterium]|nr:phosphatidylglycerol lysyltransferase domain-containing protein [Petrotogaceae bacterium]
EKIAIFRALENFDKLGLTGGILKVSGKIAGFTFGEPISEDTVLIHIEKADPDTKGAYTAINQVFLEKQWKHMSYVNREEDLGLEGLRKAKESYHPVKMIEKYGCEFKDKV